MTVQDQNPRPLTCSFLMKTTASCSYKALTAPIPINKDTYKYIPVIKVKNKQRKAKKIVILFRLSHGRLFSIQLRTYPWPWSNRSQLSHLMYFKPSFQRYETDIASINDSNKRKWIEALVGEVISLSTHSEKPEKDAEQSAKTKMFDYVFFAYIPEVLQNI